MSASASAAASAAAAAAAKTKTKSFFASTSNRIHYWLEHHPVASNSILCLNLWVLGDFLAQYSEQHRITVPSHANHDALATEEEKTNEQHPSGSDRLENSQTPNNNEGGIAATFWKEDFKLDLSRTARCASYGAFVTGPILALWYPYMDRVCGRYKLALKHGPWAAPIAKVAADEFLMDPPTLVMFFGYMNVCEGGDRKDFVEKIRTQFVPSWCTSLAIWPVVLLGTFRFLPVPVQAPVINVCCIAWDAFLSHRNALAKHAKAEAIEIENEIENETANETANAEGE